MKLRLLCINPGSKKRKNRMRNPHSPRLKAGEEQSNTTPVSAVPGWRCSWTGTSCYPRPGRSWWGRHTSAACQGPAGTGGCSHHCSACTRVWTLWTEQGKGDQSLLSQHTLGYLLSGGRKLRSMYCLYKATSQIKNPQEATSSFCLQAVLCCMQK